MDFKDFIHRLASVISGGENTSTFTRSIFEVILTNAGKDILKDYHDSTFKSFFNGSARISRFAKKINSYIEPMEFADYIQQLPDAQTENLCNVFIDVIPDITLHNAGEKLSSLFTSIIISAAGVSKKGASKSPSSAYIPPHNPNDNIDIVTKNGITFLNGIPLDSDKVGTIHPFQKYLDAASDYFSTKKTLLYAEKPHPFYDLYVCNDITYRRFKIAESKNSKTDLTIHNATIENLKKESRYIIIEGTGGIGKSMLLTHLFLSSEPETTGYIPLLLSLKDYTDEANSIVDFIWKTLKDFDSTIKHSTIIEALQNQELVLLLDGLDEIRSSVRASFDQDLDAFIKSYPGNMIIITSRPIYNFIAYSKFTIFDIEPLSKHQALSLIEKLDFWDVVAKKSFIEALDKQLYQSHYEFASNPLLLTIMLMTYSSFGEVPAKMHVFYSKAYETMARLHDATKGAFQRPLHTKLSPEDFAKYFAEFCARTYVKELFEFTTKTFDLYMESVLNDTEVQKRGVVPRDFLQDLTDNLCIMYQEGEKYYFIHRSFQEYFTAFYFASGYDAKLKKVGDSFEKKPMRFLTDKTFDMLYDMIPDKIERYIFYPKLTAILNKCNHVSDNDAYWEFLDTVYSELYYHEGENFQGYDNNESTSFIYTSIVKLKSLGSSQNLDDLPWPKQISEFPTMHSIKIFNETTNKYEFTSLDFIDQRNGYQKDYQIDEITQEIDNLVTDEYISLYGKPKICGKIIEINIHQLRRNPSKYAILRNFMEQPNFPIFVEYQNVKKYYEKLQIIVHKNDNSDDLFDD